MVDIVNEFLLFSCLAAVVVGLSSRPRLCSFDAGHSLP
jgi:hypothetical protein